MPRDDGSVTISVKADVGPAQKDLAKLNGQIRKMEDDLSKKQGEQSGIKAELDTALSAAKATEDKVKELKKELESVENVTDWTKGGLKGPSPDEFLSALDRQKEIPTELEQQEALLAKQTKTAERLATQYTKVSDAVAKQEATLNAAKAQAGALVGQAAMTESATDKAAERANKIEEAMSHAAESVGARLNPDLKESNGILDQVSRRVNGLVKRVLFFSVITTALRGLKNWLSSVVKASPQTAKALERLKAALLTLVQPLVNIIIPAVERFLNLMTALVIKLASFISQMFGTTLEDSAAAAKALQEEQEALEGVGGAAKKSGKELAGFDEINKLGDEDSGGGGGGVDYAGSITEGANSILGAISGAVLLALGALLTFTGHPVVGIPMMVAGAITIYQSAMGDSKLAEMMVENGFTAIMKVVGGLLAIIGILLVLFSAHILLGLGLIVAGITLIYSGKGIEEGGDLGGDVVGMLQSIANTVGILVAVIGIVLILFSPAHLLLGLGLFISGIALWTFANVSDDEGASLTEKITSCLSKIAGIVGPFLAILGIIFILSLGRFVEGFGLLAAGIALWTFSEMQDDEGATMTEKIVLALANIATAVGPFLAILGLALMFVPGQLAVGLGLLVLGIALFAAGNAVMDANEVGTPLIDALSEVLTTIGLFLFVIGMILIFIPGMQGIGFGLMVAGIAAVAAGSIMPNWDFILEKLKGAWEAIKSWWDTTVSKFTDPDWWFEIGSSMLDGLFNGFKSIWDTITGWVSDGINWIKEKFGGAKAEVDGEFNSGGSFGGSRSGSPQKAATRSVSISDVPHLAQGAVIPPNREFMAVLGDQKRGTNVETPLATIEQALQNVFNRSGMGGGGGRQITVIMQLDRQELGRAVYELNNEQTQRVGLRLAGGRL